MELFLSANSIDITPDYSIPLSGFAERSSVYTDVHDRLEINLTALKQGEQIVLLYSFDTIFVPYEFELLIANQFNIPEECIWMMASHTHFAPSLDKEKPVLGEVDDEYYTIVKNKLLELTQTVVESEFKKVSIEYGSSTSELNVNRRKKLWRPKKGGGLFRKVLLYPDYEGVKDDSIHTIKLINESGKVETILWNYACHAVGFPKRNSVSADFIGHIRMKIREEYNTEKLPVIFMLGFAGNLKPDVSVATNTRWQDKLGYLFQLGAKYMRFPGMDAYSEWIDMLWGEVNSSLSKTEKAYAAKIKTAQTEIPLNRIIGNSDKSIRFKKLELFNKEFVGISSEVFAEYKEHVKNVLEKETINIGCLAGTYIYLPTDKNVKEGGYEVEMFQSRFGIDGEFKNGIDVKIREALQRL